ncbi:MAG: hypothetical protein KF872_05825 [Chitinophagales bacterium]|nr:hypothetical protein [Chitinophagales bacterium]
MKAVYLLLAAVCFATTVSAQVASTLKAKPDSTQKLLVVEASCGECNFGLPGNDCDLAIRMNKKAYYVDGVGIKEYGHPHDKNGFCVAVRKAEVQGEVVDGRFKATYFHLLDIDTKGAKGPKESKGKK